MGMTDVACFAARTIGVAYVTITSTLSRTNSSLLPSAQRYAMPRLRPSTHPSSPSRCKKAAVQRLWAAGVPEPNPMVRSFPASVAYYRVSTQQQGKSGLGLEAQKEAVERFAAAEGFEVANNYVEVESGADDDRPQLLAAMAEARRLHCPLLVNKLDRLSRDVNHLTGLWKFGRVQIIHY
jgi:hypothetical protein